MEKILVAGAGGRLGSRVLKELGRRGLRSRSLVRDRARLDAAGVRPGEVFVADARERGALKGACDGVDAVVSALGASLALGRTRGGASYHSVDLGANLNLLKEAREAGVRKFVYVSLFGAESLRGLAYVEAHEEFVAALGQSGLDYAVVRPTGFFYVFGEIFKMARDRGRALVIGPGDSRTNPVHEADVARACADALGGGGPREIPLGGPETYTRREIAELAFEALGTRPKITSVPAGLMLAAAAPLKLFDRRLSDLLEFGVAASLNDLVAPASGTRSLREYFLELASKDPAPARPI
ncbi:MAG TPA: SDR family oxidoreductase [Pyrinomonadaceae bacterium]|nr:SDR family oxidoreductase [Pyrinomonadaceae bacterium]